MDKKLKRDVPKINVMITGAAGFLGKKLAQKLAINPFINLYLVDKSRDVYELDSLGKPFKLDINADLYNFDRDFDNIDVIFHFASPCSILMYDENPEIGDRAKQSFHTVKRLAEKTEALLIIPSTGSLSAEEINAYAKTKQYFEDQMGWNGCYYRIFAAFGYEERKGKYASVIYKFCKAALNDEEIEVWGDGTQVRDFIHVDDAIDQMLENLKKNILRKDIASGHQASFNEILSIISELTGKKLKIKYIDKPSGYLTSTKSQVEFEEKYPLKEKIKLVLDEIKFHQEEEQRILKLIEGAKKDYQNGRTVDLDDAWFIRMDDSL